MSLLVAAFIVHVLCNAPDRVAAHHAFRTVEIEHYHAAVSDLGRSDEHDTVTAYAEVSVTHIDGE